MPILYLPWMSFPLGTERKSGFLFPTLGHSTRGGVQFALPYYWNIAPNADLTFEPTYYPRRGLDLSGDTRFLSESTKTSLEYSYLPDDDVTHTDRSRFKLTNVTKLPYDFRFVVDAETVSDSHYFEDFATGPEGTSIAFLERRAGFRYRDEHWNLSADAQQFQTIDRDLAEVDRPYARVPRIVADADYGWGPEERLRYGFDSEVVNFDRDTGVTGWRSMRTPAFRSTSAARARTCDPASRCATRAIRSTTTTTRRRAPTSPSRTLPMESLDAGLVFERDSGSRGQRRLTLEPRMLYLHVPYKNQDDLPLFDTGIPDPEPRRAVPHEPLRRRGSRERREPGEPGRDEPPVRYEERRAVSRRHPRPDVLLLAAARAAARRGRTRQQHLRFRRPGCAHRLQELERRPRHPVESRPVAQRARPGQHPVQAGRRAGGQPRATASSAAC